MFFALLLELLLFDTASHTAMQTGMTRARSRVARSTVGLEVDHHSWRLSGKESDGRAVVAPRPKVSSDIVCVLKFCHKWRFGDFGSRGDVEGWKQPPLSGAAQVDSLPLHLVVFPPHKRRTIHVFFFMKMHASDHYKSGRGQVLASSTDTLAPPQATKTTDGNSGSGKTFHF